MSLANRAILSHPKGARAEGEAWVIRMLVEDYEAQLKRANGKESFDHDPGGSLPDLIEHEGAITGRPSSVGLAVADFDAGESDWLTDILDKRSVPYVKVRRNRGDHVHFPFVENSGGDFRWDGHGGHGEVIVDMMVVLDEPGIWIGLLEKIGEHTLRANLKSIFRKMGWKPRVTQVEIDELSDVWAGVNAPLRKRGKYDFGKRMNQFNANVWYDVQSGLNPRGRIGQVIRACIPDREDKDKYVAQVKRAFKSTVIYAAQWKSSCLEAARNLAAIVPGFTPAFMHVLAAMLSFAKMTNECWANQENIARAAGCTDRTVRNATHFLLKYNLICFEGHHYSGTCLYSFVLGRISDKLSFGGLGGVVSLVRRLLDDVDSVVLPSTTTSTPRQPALRMPDRAPP